MGGHFLTLMRKYRWIEYNYNIHIRTYLCDFVYVSFKKIKYVCIGTMLKIFKSLIIIWDLNYTRRHL